MHKKLIILIGMGTGLLLGMTSMTFDPNGFSNQPTIVLASDTDTGTVEAKLNFQNEDTKTQIASIKYNLQYTANTKTISDLLNGQEKTPTGMPLVEAFKDISELTSDRWSASYYQQQTGIPGDGFLTSLKPLLGFSIDTSAFDKELDKTFSKTGPVDINVPFRKNDSSVAIKFQKGNENDGPANLPSNFKVEGVKDSTPNAKVADFVPSIDGYTAVFSQSDINFNSDNGKTITVVYAKNKNITVHYVMPSGSNVTAPTDQTIGGYVGHSPVTVTSPAITGYTPDQSAVSVAFTDGAPTIITVNYTQNKVDAVAINSNNGNTINPVTNGSSSDTATSPTEPVDSAKANHVNAKSAYPFKVYAKTAIYKYQSTNFKKSQRIRKYVKRVRSSAPIFTVTKTVKDSQGHWRYKVAGGYITANSKNVGFLYWQSNQYKKLSVTNPKGTYEYRSTIALKRNRVKLLKEGTTVKVKGVVHNGMTTRYLLTDGNYVTGDKRVVTPIKIN
jgi:hypothetical protein